MIRTHFRTAAVALALSLGLLAAPARAAEVLDHSNSASATGNPFETALAASRPGTGASPADDSRSASARGTGLAFTGAATSARNAWSRDDSNSASALGGPGTGPVGGRDAAAGRLVLGAR